VEEQRANERYRPDQAKTGAGSEECPPVYLHRRTVPIHETCERSAASRIDLCYSVSRARRNIRSDFRDPETEVDLGSAQEVIAHSEIGLPVGLDQLHTR